MPKEKTSPRRRNFVRRSNTQLGTSLHSGKRLHQHKPKSHVGAIAGGDARESKRRNAVRHGDSWMVAANGRSGHGCSRNAGHGWPEWRPSVASRPPKHEGIPSGTEATEQRENRESPITVPMALTVARPNTGAVPVRDGDIRSGSPFDRREPTFEPRHLVSSAGGVAAECGKAWMPLLNSRRQDAGGRFGKSGRRLQRIVLSQAESRSPKQPLQDDIAARCGSQSRMTTARTPLILRSRRP